MGYAYQDMECTIQAEEAHWGAAAALARMPRLDCCCSVFAWYRSVALLAVTISVTVKQARQKRGSSTQCLSSLSYLKFYTKLFTLGSFVYCWFRFFFHFCLFSYRSIVLILCRHIRSILIMLSWAAIIVPSWTWATILAASLIT